MPGRVVVITGASAGIGAALAELLGARGARLVLAARRERELREVAARSGPEALPVVADVTRRADVQRILDAALARFGHVDVWVNNAGRGISALVSELTDEDLDEMFLANVKSALYGMQVVLPHFKERRRGHVVNVSSMLSRVPLVPTRSAYSAAKHALNALTTSLRLELRKDFPDVHVTTVLPGMVATDFAANARHGVVDARAALFAQPVGEVAQVIADVIEHPRAEVYTRPQYHQQVAAYFAADDVTTIEATSPFAPRPR